MDRLNKFNSLKNHAYLGKIYSRLSINELSICHSFIELNNNLTVGDFESKINRMFLDKDKPKNWTIVQELLCSVK